MYLKTPVLHLLNQLRYELYRLSDEQFAKPVELLSQATIGQHTRHVIEFFLELGKGYEGGVVNYDQRRRDLRIETDRDFALAKIEEIGETLAPLNKPLLLVADLNKDAESRMQVRTNYFRELLYNLEHTVHHMALIRIGIVSVSGSAPGAAFGVAVSTLKFRQACAQ